ncbi:hypothetical protein EUAN_06880 [Andreesenia angusta]|uniref:Uncharacterized protein n=1 Tax=Andreesenia angusta TaxID=39480 RepID=A0A1S1V8S2_9FIRM|nr:hypothetical protein [Andreesenia angusta]OHW62904.1 hypothetical protein EUAN_06880 [Andreesenia angusta]
MSKTIGVILSLKDKLSAPMKKARDSVKDVTREMKRSRNQIKDWGKGIGKTVGDVASKVKKVSLAFGGLAAGAAIKTGLTEAMDLEGYRVQLETATKDSKKAGDIMKWAVNMANKTPFEAGPLVEGASKLEMMGMSAKKYLPMIGDMAAATNKPVDQAVEAMIDAQTGELERLKEFGITKAQIAKKANEMFRDQEVINAKGQITDQEKFNEALMSIMQERYSGGMDALSNTTRGLWSTVTGVTKSALAQIVGITSDGTIRQGSLMETLKGKIKSVGETLTRWQEDGTIDRISEKIKSGVDIAVEVFGKLKDAVMMVKDNMNILLPAVAGVASAMAAFSVMSKIQGAFKIWSAATKTQTTLQWLLNSALLANPLFWVAIAIGAVVAIGIVLYKNWDKIKAKADELFSTIKEKWDGIKSATSEKWNAVKETLSGIWDGIKSIASTIWEGIKTAVGAAVKGMLAVVIGPVGMMAILIYKNWDKVKVVLLKAWEVIKTAASNAWNAISSTVMSVVGPIISFLTTAWTLVKTVIEAVFKGILAVIIIVLSTIWNTISGVFTSIWTTISGVLTAIWTIISTIWTNILNFYIGVLTAIWGVISNAFTTIWTTITSVLTTIWTTIMTIWNSILAFWTGIVTAIWGAISSAFTSIYSTISSILSSIWSTIVSIWNNIKSAISNAINAIKSAVSSGFSAMASSISNVFNGVKSTISGIFNGILSTIRSILNTGIGMVNGFIGKVNGAIKTANKVPGVNIGTVGKVPMFAKGGIATGPSVFGEAGPEMAIPLKRNARSRMLLEQTNRIIGGPEKKSDTGDKKINITVKVDTLIGRREFIDEVGSEIERSISLALANI